MMTDKQLVARLLELQEHPEQVTDEQIRQMLNDEQMREVVEQMAFAKRTFKNEESLTEELPIAEEWEKFAASHAEELDALEEASPKPRFALRLSAHKIAASFIGAVLASGIALAAIHIWNLPSSPSPKGEGSSYMQPSDTIKHFSPLPNRSGAGGEATVIFDNVPLDTMLMEMADYYHFSVEFKREEARQLRFHFVWKPSESLDRVLERLSNFEAVNIEKSDTIIIVE